MKIYEIYITRVSEDWGNKIGSEKIATVSTKEKVSEKIASYRAEHEVNQFWMAFATDRVDGKRKIRFTVKEIEIT